VDLPAAESFISALALLCDVFLNIVDIVSLTTGREWADRLESALKSADVFLIPVTPNSTIHAEPGNYGAVPKNPTGRSANPF
jgi:hypothetical protein